MSQSEWFNSDEQVAKRAAQSERTRMLQEQARFARQQRLPSDSAPSMPQDKDMQ